MNRSTYSHEQVLDGAVGVWAEGDTIAVWQGGRTLNTYVAADEGWQNGSAHEWMEQPEREQVAEQARLAITPGGTGDDLERYQCGASWGLDEAEDQGLLEFMDCGECDGQIRRVD